MLKILFSLHSVKHHSQISILNSSLLIKTTTHHIFFYLGWGFVRLFRIKKSTFLDMPSPYILFARIRSTKLRSSHGFIYSLFFLIAAVIDPSFIILQNKNMNVLLVNICSYVHYFIYLDIRLTVTIQISTIICFSFKDKMFLMLITGSKTLGFLCHNFQGCRADVKSTSLSTMVRPTLEYAETVWDPYLQTQTQCWRVSRGVF